MPDALIYRVGLQPGGPPPCAWEGPQAREPSKGMNAQSYGEGLAVDTGGKNTQEQDQIRIWAAPQQVQRPTQCWRAS